MKWLDQTFAEFPDQPTEDQVSQFARAYILKLIGEYLMPDKSSSVVYLMYLSLLSDLSTVGSYSWGSAVLSYLYRELCNGTNPNARDISGCMVLLHLWAWDRLTELAPQRPELIDPRDDVFGIPPPLGYRWTCIGGRLRPKYDSLRKYRLLLDRLKEDEVWNNWSDRVVSGPPYHDGLHRNSEYMHWYWRHTRRWMHVSGGAAGFAYDRAAELRERSHNPPGDFEDFVDRTCRDIMVALGEERDGYVYYDDHPAPQPPDMPRPDIPPPRPSKRPAGYAARRAPVEPAHIIQQEDQQEHDAPPLTPHPPPPAPSLPTPPYYPDFGGAGPSSSTPTSFAPVFGGAPIDPYTPISYSGSMMDLLNTQSFMTPYQPITYNYQTPGVIFRQPLGNDESSSNGATLPEEEQQHQEPPPLQRRRSDRDRRRPRCGTGGHLQ